MSDETWNGNERRQCPTDIEKQLKYFVTQMDLQRVYNEMLDCRREIKGEIAQNREAVRVEIRAIEDILANHAEDDKDMVRTITEIATVQKLQTALLEELKTDVKQNSIFRIQVIAYAVAVSAVVGALTGLILKFMG